MAGFEPATTRLSSEVTVLCATGLTFIAARSTRERLRRVAELVALAGFSWSCLFRAEVTRRFTTGRSLCRRGFAAARRAQFCQGMVLQGLIGIRTQSLRTYQEVAMKCATDRAVPEGMSDGSVGQLTVEVTVVYATQELVRLFGLLRRWSVYQL